jgi:hypothetical protein
MARGDDRVEWSRLVLSQISEACKHPSSSDADGRLTAGVGQEHPQSVAQPDDCFQRPTGTDTYFRKGDEGSPTAPRPSLGHGRGHDT